MTLEDARESIAVVSPVFPLDNPTFLGLVL